MSTPSWKTLSQVPIGASIQSAIDAVNAVVSAINAVLNAVVAGLEIIRALAVLTLNLLKSIVQQLLNLIRELIFDLLEYNLACTLHLNVNWNPDWRFNKERERDPRTGKIDPRLIDYANDSQLPWSGTGTVGWLLDIAASAEDPTDPFRPVTDSNTAVYGSIILKGVENPNELESSLRLSDWLDLFTNWDGFRLDFDKVKEPKSESLAKLASSAFLEALPFYRSDPKESQFLSFKNSIVDLPNNQGELENYGKLYYPTPGSYPKWISVPLATLVPPIQQIASTLQNLLGLLSFTDDFFDILSKLIDAINGKLAALQEAIQQLQDALNLLIALAAFITDTYMFVYKIDSGGMSSFISQAIAADNIPVYGTAGIVVGAAFFATNPDSMASLEKFWEFLGVEISAYSDTVTASAEAIDQTFEDLFP